MMGGAENDSRREAGKAVGRAGWTARLCGLAVLISLAGCHCLPAACDRDCVSSKLAARTGHGLLNETGCGQIVYPNGASLSDGLSEEESVLLALWNNAAFQEQLVDWKIAHGDLVQAGLLPNPELFYVPSAPDKPFRYSVEFPIEALWLRPIRIAAAERESLRVCERLTQAGLDLIRDTRQVPADILTSVASIRTEIEAAVPNGYTRLHYCQGGAYAISGLMARRMSTCGYLRQPERWVNLPI